MALKFTNLNTSVPKPPEAVVHFKVDVNREQCGIITTDTEQRLKGLEAGGIELSLTDLIATAGAHFRDGAVDFSRRGSAHAEIQRAWDILAHCEPKAIYNRSYAVEPILNVN